MVAGNVAEFKGKLRGCSHRRREVGFDGPPHSASSRRRLHRVHPEIAAPIHAKFHPKLSGVNAGLWALKKLP